MEFSTAEIADLIGTGHHGPSCVVQTVAIDPREVEAGRDQLFAASAHPPPLGDTSLELRDGIADLVPYLTERSWMGGTAVNGPSVETMLRSMAADPRGRPSGGPRIGVLGTIAPWATAALVASAFGGAEADLPPAGPWELREPPGTERFRLPLAVLNHPGGHPLAMNLGRKHRGCSAADAALLDPTATVITDLGDRHLATLGRRGAIDAALEVLDRLRPTTTLCLPRHVAETLTTKGGFDAGQWTNLATYEFELSTPGTEAHGSPAPRGDADGANSAIGVSGAWGDIEFDLDGVAASLAPSIAGALAVGVSTGDDPVAVARRVGAAVEKLGASMSLELAEGPVVWDRSDATSFGDASAAIEALAVHPASTKFAVLGPLDDGPTVVGGLHGRLGRQATNAGIVVRSADAWGSGFSFLEHPQVEVDDLSAAGPGAVILLVGGGAELSSVRERILRRAGALT